MKQTLAWGTAGVAAAAVAAVVLSAGAAPAEPGPRTAPGGVAQQVVRGAVIDAGGIALTYEQSGATVTAALDGVTVASLTLKSWTWSGRAGTVVLAATATRPFTIDPMTFNLAADDSNENSPTDEEPVRLSAGTQDVTLHFEGFRSPGALLWTPQASKSDDDDGIAGHWALSSR